MRTDDRVKHTGLTDFIGIVLFAVHNQDSSVNKGHTFDVYRNHGVPLDHVVCFTEDSGETRTFPQSALEVILDED